jgi:hypothetical protein
VLSVPDKTTPDDERLIKGYVGDLLRDDFAAFMAQCNPHISHTDNVARWYISHRMPGNVLRYRFLSALYAMSPWVSSKVSDTKSSTGVANIALVDQATNTTKDFIILKGNGVKAKRLHKSFKSTMKARQQSDFPTPPPHDSDNDVPTT